MVKYWSGQKWMKRNISGVPLHWARRIKTAGMHEYSGGHFIKIIQYKCTVTFGADHEFEELFNAFSM